MQKSLTALRAKFGRTSESFHKQIGLRYIRDALTLLGRNDEAVAELHAKAKFHLPYAEAAR